MRKESINQEVLNVRENVCTSECMYVQICICMLCMYVQVATTWLPVSSKVILVYFPCTITWNTWGMETSPLLEKILFQEGEKSYSDLNLRERIKRCRKRIWTGPWRMQCLDAGRKQEMGKGGVADPLVGLAWVSCFPGRSPSPWLRQSSLKALRSWNYRCLPTHLASVTPEKQYGQRPKSTKVYAIFPNLR